MAPFRTAGRTRMSDGDPPILAVIGPTASGKSALALAAAERAGAEILCVDSMTVYRGMEVGTAKPSPAERARVRHHLLDVAEPTETFTVARFVELADAAIADARRRGRAVVAVGGTPMYFKALFEGLFEGPGADTGVRQRLGGWTSEALHARLSEIDPAAAARIHLNDRKRMIRAIEVFELTGQPISSLQIHWNAEDTPPAWRHPVRWVGLHWEREALNRRINGRVKEMLAAGWVEEVRSLLARHGQLSKTAAEAAGYAELIAHAEGRMSLEEAVEQTKISTRQLARRQVKWFRRFRDVTWFDGAAPPDPAAVAAAMGA